MKSFTLKFALTFLLGVGLASAAVAQKIGGTTEVRDYNDVTIRLSGRYIFV